MPALHDVWSVLTGPTAQVLGWTLVHFLWQGALVAAVLFGALRLLRRHKPRLRYVVGCGALFLLLALPAGTAVLLSVEGTPFVEGVPGWAGGERLIAHERVGAGSSSLVKDASSISWWAWAGVQVHHALPWILLGWGLGALGCAVRLLRGTWQEKRLRQRAAPAPERWRKRVGELADQLGLGGNVSLRRSRHVSVPTIAGWWRPVLLVPTGFLAGLPPAYVEAILLHELAHVRRHDVLIARVQAFCETVFFYHPATWWISRRIRQIREDCCDDRVLEGNVDRVTYAKALTSVAEQARGGNAPAVRPAATGDGQLLARIRRILNPPGSLAPPKQMAVAFAAACLLLGGPAVAMYAAGPLLTVDVGGPRAGEAASVVLTQDSTGAVVIKPSRPSSAGERPATTDPADKLPSGEDRYADLNRRWGRMPPDSLLRSVRSNFDLAALNDRLGGSLPRDLLRASLHVHPDSLRRSARNGNGSVSLDEIRRSIQARSIQARSMPGRSDRLGRLHVHPDTLQRAVRREVNVSLGRTLRERLNADTLTWGVEVHVELGVPDTRSRRFRPQEPLAGARGLQEGAPLRRRSYVNQPDSMMSQALERTLQDTTILLGKRQTIIRSTRSEGSSMESS
jgi:beta-lactamase regulating signal transducer with metallopeptidase domain